MARRPIRSDALRRPAARRGCGVIGGRRLGLCAVLAAVGLASSAVPASADRQAVVATIHEKGGVLATPPPVTIEALEDNAACMRYVGPAPALYDQSGSIQAQPPGTNSWSLSTVLECGLVPPVLPSAVTELIVRQLSGAAETGKASTLSAADLTPAGDFADSAQPLIAYDGSNILYYRPWRGGTDQNYRDKVEEPSPSPLAIDVYEGPPLTVVAQSSNATVTAGATVAFSATVSDAGDAGSPDPATLTYAWDFDDGTASSTAAAPKVAFPDAGTYSVTVEVTDQATGGGGVDTTLLTVNPAANTPTPPAPPANAPPTGPLKSGGVSPGAGPGKHTTSHVPGATKHPVAKTGRPAKSSAASKPSASKHAKTTPLTTTAPPVTTTPASTATTPAATHPAAAASTPVKGPHQRPGGSPLSAGTVDGRLISNVVALPAQTSPLVSVVAATPATAPEVRRPVRASIVPVLAAVLAVLLLLSLGARHQLGWRPRPGSLLAGS